MDNKLAAIILEGPQDFDMTAELSALTPAKWQITIYRLAGASRIVITGSNTGMKQIERTCTKLGVEFVGPDKSDSGISGGLCAALRFLKGKCGRALVAPMNFPLFETETARCLATADGHISIPVYNGERGWPVAISEELFDELLELGGDLDTFLGTRDAQMITMYDEGVTMNAAVSNAAALAEGHSLRRFMRPMLRLSLSYEHGFFGPGVLQVLRLIDETGSVTRAMQLMGMSKSNGWAMINKFEKYTGIKIFDFVGHGSPNNRSVVSNECRAFLERYEAFVDDCERYAAESFKRHFG